MDLPCLHNKDRLINFTEIPDKGFDFLFTNVQHSNKDNGKRLLIYFDKLINDALRQPENILRYTHIHLEGLDDHVIDLLAEFIAVKFFFIGLTSDSNESQNDHITNNIHKADRALGRPLRLPEGVKGGSRQEKALKEERLQLKKLKSFYEKILAINSGATLTPKTLMNILNRTSDFFEEQLKSLQFAVQIGKFPANRSYVITNCELSRDNLDKITFNGQAFLDHIQNVILFDCEQKLVHRQFNYRELQEWNEISGNFKHLLIISINNTAFSFAKLKSRLDRIMFRYHSEPAYPNYGAHIIMPQEVGHLMEKHIDNKIQIELFGDPSCSFWDDFKLSIRYYEGLYELYSLKMMNIYSLVLNEELKEIILKDIFLFTEPSVFITKESRDYLEELSIGDLQELQYNLSSTLDWIMEQRWNDKLINSMLGSTPINVIVPEIIRQHPIFERKLKGILIKNNQSSLTTWFNIEPYLQRDLLILDYRDTGPFPFNITPNIIEPYFKGQGVAKALFPAVFFKNKYEWASFNYTKEVISILNDPIRKIHFHWEDVYKNHQKLKPHKEDITNWDAENKYQPLREIRTIRVRFKPTGKKSYNPSELFIVKYSDEVNLKVARLEDIMHDYTDHTKISIQWLDEFTSGFNIYEKLANHNREENELAIIRKNYDLDPKETANRLWKILLRKRSKEKGIDWLYADIEMFLSKKGLKIVSKNTFVSSWIEPESSSLIPREKKVFLYLCEYIGLPKTYFRIMLRLKNVEIENTRSTSRQMNNLLSDLINDGCFNENANVLAILQEQKEKYLIKNDFDEIGIAEEQMIDEMSVLVDLLKPHLRLTQVEIIEINEL